MHILSKAAAKLTNYFEKVQCWEW